MTAIVYATAAAVAIAVAVALCNVATITIIAPNVIMQVAANKIYSDM